MFASKDIFLKSSGGYQISRSVRLRSSASAYFNRTQTAGSQTTWTWSGWVKLGLTGGSYIFHAGSSSGSGIYYDVSGEELQCEIGNGTTQYYVRTSAAFRDFSAWYHLVCVADTSNGTSTDRLKIYINGVRQTIGTSSLPTSGFSGTVSQSGVASNIGKFGGGSSAYFDGYLTEINFIDGQALTPSSFGQTNSVTGVWEPIKYTGTYGTNGFYLNFSDNSNNTAATIGKDFSGNGNNWTPNNISVTSGVTYDSMLDVPTLTSATAANFAVFNPVNVSGGGTTTITNGNLATSVGSTTTFGKVLGSIGMSTGKWYWEVTVTAVGGAGNIGIGDGTPPSGSYGLGGVAGEISYQSSGNKYTNNSGTAYGASYTTNDIIGVAYDADAGSITFYKNNTSQGAITGFSGTKFAAVGSGGGTNPQYAINFGQQPFTYTPPTGYVALNTQNLPAPTISNGASYMAATTYTGTGSALTIANTVGSASFQPDFVWVKGRSGATDHALYDAVRGVQNQLESNTTTDETTETTGLTAFGSTGFTVGALAQMNTSAATYVAWQWKEGATQGFDIVTYTGNGIARTISHNLGVAPNMIIVKARTTASTDQGWPVYHSANTAAPATDYLLLNSTAATADLDTVWNDTAPTSSVFSVGTNANVNANNDTYVAYCFAAVAGYSAFGSYTGNGSADGPFVFTNFRPRWVMIKASGLDESWFVYDSARNTYNVMDLELNPNNSGAEATFTTLDFVSNGFKIRNTNSAFNTNGATYIFAAFAEVPFKSALGR